MDSGRSNVRELVPVDEMALNLEGSPSTVPLFSLAGRISLLANVLILRLPKQATSHSYSIFDTSREQRTPEPCTEVAAQPHRILEHAQA